MAYSFSFYNVLINENNGNSYIWNTKSGAIVELKDELLYQLKNNNFASQEIIKFLPDLLKTGIIVDQHLNELEEIVFKAKQKQLSLNQDSFSLVITPTMKCNYNCSYCFESNNKYSQQVMSSATIDSIVAMIAKRFNDSSIIKKHKISWFGGEPLLAYADVIVPLQKKVYDLCKSKNVYYAANIVTNGYFLTKEKFDFLFKETNTQFIQITFDGDENEYCSRKRVTKDAYYRVLDNVLELSEYLYTNDINARINIRLNVDNNNYESIKTFVSTIKSNARFHSNITFSLAKLRCYDFCKDCNDYCTTEEYENILYQFEEFINKPKYIFEPKTTFCGQHCMNVLCIGVNGELYKCEHDFGVCEHSVGHVNSGLYYNDYFLKFMEQDLPQKCKKCVILPVCMGGCPHRRLMTNQNFECEHTLQALIKLANKYIDRR